MLNKALSGLTRSFQDLNSSVHYCIVWCAVHGGFFYVKARQPVKFEVNVYRSMKSMNTVYYTTCHALRLYQTQMLVILTAFIDHYAVYILHYTSHRDPGNLRYNS